MGVVVCLSINQGELLGEYRGVEAGGRKRRGSDDESSGAQLPKSKVSVGKEIDSEECHSTIKANLSMVRKRRKCEATDSRAMGLVAPWYCREVKGIANSKNLVLMQGLVHERRSVRGYPKARSELGPMEHWNFLFGMKRIYP
ncbi:hypothetical protein GW17_00051941 [Ensete ventricosum]|nr:hypothetical protein GW17_00051941 [Ensete ventricosum]